MAGEEEWCGDGAEAGEAGPAADLHREWARRQARFHNVSVLFLDSSGAKSRCPACRVHLGPISLT